MELTTLGQRWCPSKDHTLDCVRQYLSSPKLFGPLATQIWLGKWLAHRPPQGGVKEVQKPAISISLLLFWTLARDLGCAPSERQPVSWSENVRSCCHRAPRSIRTGCCWVRVESWEMLPLKVPGPQCSVLTEAELVALLDSNRRDRVWTSAVGMLFWPVHLSIPVRQTQSKPR